MTHAFALFAREVKRFQKLWIDTVFSPIITVVLYLSVFGVVTGGQAVGDVPYITFVYTGLLGMIMINSSFSNPGFGLVVAKNMGNIVDLQLAPLRPWEVGLAYAGAALVRALTTIALCLLVTAWFIPFTTPANIPLFIIGLVLAGLEFGLLGVVFGMYAKNFEALTFMTQWIMQPMIFLGGVFYPLQKLPQPWDTISQINPLHHTVNIIRYAATGHADAPLTTSFLVVGILTVTLVITMHYVTQRKLQA